MLIICMAVCTLVGLISLPHPLCRGFRFIVPDPSLSSLYLHGVLPEFGGLYQYVESGDSFMQSGKAIAPVND